VQAALAALQLAEAKLSRVDRPQLVTLRRALARDIDRLKAVPYVDIAGMSLKLDQAIAAIDTLPLARDERLPAAPPPPPATDESTGLRFLREAWNEVRSLIRIEVADRPAAPLVPPPQQYFLRENLRLRLLAARVALPAVSPQPGPPGGIVQRSGAAGDRGTGRGRCCARGRHLGLVQGSVGEADPTGRCAVAAGVGFAVHTATLACWANQARVVLLVER